MQIFFLFFQQEKSPPAWFSTFLREWWGKSLAVSSLALSVSILALAVSILALSVISLCEMPPLPEGEARAWVRPQASQNTKRFPPYEWSGQHFALGIRQ